jgi:elongation factor 1-gamma
MATLYTDKGNPQAYKALIAARYSGIPIDVPNFDVSSRDSNEFTKKSPLAKIPVLETKEGSIWEANAIARYVARQGKGSLYGATPFEASLIDNWIEYAANEIELPAAVWVFPILGYIPNNAVATNKAKADIRKTLEFLNKHLLTRTFLVGERISLADIVVAVALLRLYERVLDAPFRKQFGNTNRWFLTCINQPEFKAVLGEVKLSEKMEVAPESAASAEGGKKEEKKPKEQPKKEQPKKEEKKPKEQPKKKEAEEEEEESYDDEAKNKKPNPLDSLPPSKLNLEEWKRVYSNEATRPTALSWFWDHYDAEGYSIWFGEYKYNHECEKLFMTLNLLGGFIQRLDKVRKYAFGSLIIFGEEPKLEVSCVFLFRGKDMPPEFTIVDDVEHYTWKKADTNDAATRTLIEDYFAWDGNLGGKRFNQGKIFK